MLFQELNSNRKRNILPEQIDFALNIGMRVYIDKKISPHLDNTGRKIASFDTQRRLDDLRILRVKDYNLTIEGTPFKGALPSDYMYLINDRTRLTYCEQEYISPNRLIDPEYLHEYIASYLHGPSARSPISDISGSSIYVYLPAGATSTNMIIDYLRAPKKIALENRTVSMLVAGQPQDVSVVAQECELPEHTHEKIARLAVDELLLGVHSPNYQQQVANTIMKSPE